MNYIPPKPKVVDKALESFKNLVEKPYDKREISLESKESKSALNKFVMQDRIDGKDGFDPDLFLVNAKQPITNLLVNRQQYKVKLILSCMMEMMEMMDDLKGGEVIAKEEHSIIEHKLTYKVLTLTN